MIQVATEKLKRREWVHIYVAAVPPRRCLPLRRS